MNTLKKIMICAAASAGFLPMHADTVLVDENFNSDYTKTIQYWYDADQQDIASAIRALFVSSSDNEVKPWWIVRDNSESTDKMMASYSWFTEPAMSSKWLITRPLEIESTGFVMEFDAQSVVVRDLNRLSTLSVYITEALIDPEALPTEPTARFEDIPYGDDPEYMENDWTHYTLSLDDFAGKSVYVNIVNESYDKDIVCIDNLMIYRKDPLAMDIDAPGDFCQGENYTVSVVLTNVSEAPVVNPVVTLTDEKNELKRELATMQPGDTETVAFEVPIDLGESRSYRLVLSAEDMPSLSYSGTTSCLVFTTERKVLLEESTGTWCGYCPLGIYAMECMEEDEEFKDAIVPVSVHYPGEAEYMNYFCGEYDQWLQNYTGGNVAPSFVINRKVNRGLTNSDYNYNPADENTLSYYVKQLMAEPTPLRIKVSGEFNVVGNDTVSITAKAVVASGRDEDEGRYRIGFVLKENNVGLDGSSAWVQQNYLAGKSQNGNNYNGWGDLPNAVRNYRWQDVARLISGFYGMPGSLPKVMEAGKDYEFEHVLVIPETRLKGEEGAVLSNAVKRDYLVVVAYVIDTETGEIMNCDAYPMSEVAEDRFTTKMYYDRYTEIESVEMECADKTTYYDLQGFEVKNPGNGVYIRRQGGKSDKVRLK